MFTGFKSVVSFIRIIQTEFLVTIAPRKSLAKSFVICKKKIRRVTNFKVRTESELQNHEVREFSNRQAKSSLATTIASTAMPMSSGHVLFSKSRSFSEFQNKFADTFASSVASIGASLARKLLARYAFKAQRPL